MNSRLATIAEASNLLLGLDRKLTRIQEEPAALPQESPIPMAFQAVNSGFGETTRQKRYVVFSDGGDRYSKARIESAWHPVEAPICDTRPTSQVLGESSRLDGRSPMLRRTS